jgi:ribosome-associated heat shock protein Hsp15
MADPTAAPGQRLDQWLWFARMTKSRTLAQALIERGKVRVNKLKVDKVSHWVKPGDVITLSSGPTVRLITIVGIGHRRGPAAEAQALYEELTPAPVQTKSSLQPIGSSSSIGAPNITTAIRPSGAGRPTKRERRATERLKDRFRES